MKIRIFALAKELDYDSKELINHCNDAGIPVKSSALASISPDERDRLLEYLDSLKSNKTSESPQATSSTPNAPQFDPEKTIGKVRSIRTMTPRSTPEPRRETPVAEKPVAETQAPVSDEVESVEDVNESTAEPEVEDVKQEPVEAKAEEAPEAEPVPELVEESPVAETDTDTEATVEEATEKESTDQYIPPIGNMGSRIRDMKPRASIPDAAPRKPKPKQKPKPSLPNLAIPPKFKAEAPVKKKDEAPAQKPDVKLTAEILDGQSPLAAHIRKHDERDRNKKAGDADTDRPSRRGRLSGITEQREERRQQRKRTPSPIDDDRDDRGNRRRNRQRRTKNIEYKSQATVEQPITVRSLSEAMGRPAKDLMTVLFKQGKMAKINDALDDDLATELAIELGVDLEIKRPVNLEDALTERLELELHKDNVELIPRAPIVTILGHVDHGKTTLVDTLRSSNVVSGEAGGITQHIAAYQVEKNGQKITFVDTPGHAAFGEMRSRGANVTDMIILVVAANDGVKPQTIECISHAKAAGVPMIVALNKIDLPDINEQKVLQELAAHNVLVSEWGGDIELVRTSGLNNIGIDDLLETILLTAELQEFKAAKNVKPYGVCLEAFRDEGRGPIAWMIVQQGTLHVGDIVVCGNAYGRIRAMFNEYDKELTEAPPSTPVKVAGLNIVPNAGSHFFVMSDVEEARAVAEERIHQGRTENLANRGGPKTLEQT
ncbi:MAG TPA: translation initiation factor IF-2, partial [Planctomycetaceae bacterium]|nr:translation initiation factor IF-2 [Planctomycetaceae bacterium]